MILFADEPTGNLDSISGSLVLEQFKALNKEGITILMVTHNQSELSYAKEDANKSLM